MKDYSLQVSDLGVIYPANGTDAEGCYRHCDGNFLAVGGDCYSDLQGPYCNGTVASCPQYNSLSEHKECCSTVVKSKHKNGEKRFSFFFRRIVNLDPN